MDLWRERPHVLHLAALKIDDSTEAIGPRALIQYVRDSALPAIGTGIFISIIVEYKSLPLISSELWTDV